MSFLNIFLFLSYLLYQLLIEKNLIEELITNSRIDFTVVQGMANQDINVIDLSDPFYNDICFHYTSEFNKDVPMKDRVLIYYPNITLCDEGCELEAVYIKNWTAKCNCLFDSGSDKVKDNALYQSQLGEIDELVSLANINVSILCRVAACRIQETIESDSSVLPTELKQLCRLFLFTVPGTTQ